MSMLCSKGLGSSVRHGPGPRRCADGDHGVGHVAHDGGAAAYGAVPAYVDKMIYVGADAHPALPAHVHAAAQARVGAYVGEVADDAVVLDGAAGVQDDAGADACAHVHHGARKDGA